MSDKKLATILISIGTLNILDYFLTQNIITKGASELNPLVNFCIETIALFPIVKLIALPLMLLFMWFTRYHWGRMKKITEKVLPIILFLYSGVALWHFFLQVTHAYWCVLA